MEAILYWATRICGGLLFFLWLPIGICYLLCSRKQIEKPSLKRCTTAAVLSGWLQMIVLGLLAGVVAFTMSSTDLVDPDSNIWLLFIVTMSMGGVVLVIIPAAGIIDKIMSTGFWKAVLLSLIIFGLWVAGFRIELGPTINR